MLELTADAVDSVTLPPPAAKLYLRRPDGTTWAAFCARRHRLAHRCDQAGGHWGVAMLRNPVEGDLRLPPGDYLCVTADSLPFTEDDFARSLRQQTWLSQARKEAEWLSRKRRRARR